MADGDPVAAALAEVRERNEGRIRAMLYTEYTVEHHVAEGDVRRLLAVLDKVLAIHVRQEKPARSWDHVCDVHRDVRGFTDPRRLNCPDCRFSEFYVCRHCSCPNDAWPCPTYRAVLAALAGKAGEGT